MPNVIQQVLRHDITLKSVKATMSMFFFKYCCWAQGLELCSCMHQHVQHMVTLIRAGALLPTMFLAGGVVTVLIYQLGTYLNISLAEKPISTLYSMETVTCMTCNKILNSFLNQLWALNSWVCVNVCVCVSTRCINSRIDGKLRK